MVSLICATPQCDGDIPLIFQQWRPSFKGVAFEIDLDTIITGRRVASHEYPSSETWDNEDLGRRRYTAEVSAYVHGEDVETCSQSLLAACTSPGPGLLVLPMRPAVSALCVACKSLYKGDELGRIWFELVFAIDPPAPFSSRVGPSLADLSGAVARAERAATAASIAHIGKKYNALGQFSAARQAAADTIALAGQALEEARAALALERPASALIAFAARRFINKANEYAHAGGLPAYITADAVSVDQVNIPFLFPAQFAAIAGMMRASAAIAAEAVTSLLKLAMFNGLMINNPANTPSVVAEKNLVKEIEGFIRRAALFSAARASLLVKFQTRGDAAAGRSSLATMFNDQIATIGNADAAALIAAMRDAVVAALTKGSAALAGVINVRLPASIPAPVIATEFYNDASRDIEIVRRNHVQHPMFCPLDIELVAA